MRPPSHPNSTPQPAEPVAATSLNSQTAQNAAPEGERPPRMAVVIPARNEAATVADVVRECSTILRCPVYVVNDASEDETSNLARAAGARVLDLPLQLGAWCATQAGLRYVRRQGYEIAITMDADGQHHARGVPALVVALQAEQADVVIGTHPQRLSRAKRIAWGYFRLLTRLDAHDFTSGLRVYGPRALDVVISRRASLLDYQDVGVLLLIKRAGLKTMDLPVLMTERAAGKSRVFSSWAVVVKYMLQTTLLCITRVGPAARARQ